MITPNIDLHSHSTISDGLLTPTELVSYASEKDVQVLALTDHDDIAGLKEEMTLSGFFLISKSIFNFFNFFNLYKKVLTIKILSSKVALFSLSIFSVFLLFFARH